MTKFIAKCAIVFALFVSVAPSFGETEVGVDVFSRHVWRGTAGPTSLSIQPTVSIPFDSNVGSTSIELWGQTPITTGDTEIDITVSQELGEYGSIGVTSYYYEGAFLNADSHDVEVGFSTSYDGVNLFVGRFVNGDVVKDDTYVELGYKFDDFNLFLGAGDGSYVTEGSGFALVNVGVGFETKGKDYGASFIYNPDTETPYLVINKSW
tara:strand:+ start:1935 stop:2558 length:624 start_codon:yes stop_codon:yes gene_type:complete